MKLLILAPYPPGEAPSQRFRFEQYLTFLQSAGIQYDYEPFLDLPSWKILHKKGNFPAKVLGVLKAFVRRFYLITRAFGYDIIFIHREASHIGPPIFEFLLCKVLKKKVIYDFDDAIWLPNYSEHNAAFHWLKMYGKVRFSMRWAWRISAGNQYLAEFAKNYNPNVYIIPTTIDTEHLHNKVKVHESKMPVVIGWTGTLTTIRYLDIIVPELEKLEKEFDFQILIISNQAPTFSLRGLRFQFWRKETEIEDLLQMDIGLMPLEDDIWAKGKCGFKALQYMALGIPPLVSPVGVNTQIVDHGVSGFVCADASQWAFYIRKLLTSADLRAEMGQKAREKVIKNYSVLSQKDAFLSLFK